MKKGFTLVEMMLVLFCLILILPLSYQVLSLLMKSFTMDIGVSQLDIFKVQFQYEMMVAYDFSDDKNLCYVKYEKDYCLVFDKERLVKTPGYEILLVSITSPNIILTDDAIILKGYYEKENFEIQFERLKQ